MSYAEGFANIDVPGIVLPLGEERLTIELIQPGQVDVVVTYAGQPVSDYTLLHWQVSTDSMRTIKVTGAEDGLHQLHDLPPGVLSVTAFSPTHSQSAVSAVQVREGEKSKVTLEVQAPVSGKGTVVDGVTRGPVEGALVQVYTSTGAQFLRPWGDPIPTGPDGGFEVDGFSPKSARINVLRRWIRVRHVHGDTIARADVRLRGDAALLAEFSDNPVGGSWGCRFPVQYPGKRR